MAIDELFTIGQLARQVGVPVRTIRFWSDQGVLPVRRRTGAGYRLYDVEAVARLELVRTLRELGLGLEAVANVLRERTTLAEIAQAHVVALDERIASLRWQRSVLRVVAARGTSTKETPLMHALAKLTASERQALVNDFVDRAFAGIAPEGPVAGIAAAMRALPPELPDNPSEAQLEAWIELAGLISDPGFAARVRQMALHSHVPAEAPAPDPAQVRSIIDPVLARGVDPAGPEAVPLLRRLVPDSLDRQGRVALREQLETFSDARVERYWQLLGILNDQPPFPATVPAFRWLIEALRARE